MKLLAPRDPEYGRRTKSDWWTAAELAAMALPGLPASRETVTRKATNERWPSRQRQGRGAGREFSIDGLPQAARAELLRRRLSAVAGAATAAPDASVALPTLTDASSRRLAACLTACKLFDRFAAGRSFRRAAASFVAAWNCGDITEADEAKVVLPTLSERTLRRVLADKKAGRLSGLAKTDWGRPQGSGTFCRSKALTDALIAFFAERPHADAARLQVLLVEQFPDGAPADGGGTLPLPSLRSIQRWMAQWRRENRATALAFINPDAYRSLARPALGRADTDIVRVNQRWEIDASPADVMCTDGRHSLYCVIDVFSRRAMASVTKTPRSEAALLLLRRAILAWGVPALVVSDNGKDFVSARAKDTLLRLGIDHEETPPYAPDQKPFVERVIGTLQHQLMELLPGYVGHSVADRTAIRSRASFAQRMGAAPDQTFSVSMTHTELQASVDRWFANVYGQRPHGSLGTSPAIRATQGGPIRRIDDEAAIDWLLMAPADGNGGKRTVTKKGISVGGIDYWCEGLISGDVVDVRMDPEDLGRVWVYRGQPWRFIGIAVNPERAGLSRSEFAARAKAAQAAFIKDRKADIARAKRTIDIDALVQRHLDGERYSTVLPLPPRAGAPHTTDDLVAAGEAAAAIDPPKPPAEPTADERAAHNVFVANFRPKPPAEETSDERFARWRAIDRRIAAGDDQITAAERRWHSVYSTTSEWRGQMEILSSFGSRPDEDHGSA